MLIFNRNITLLVIDEFNGTIQRSHNNFRTGVRIDADVVDRGATDSQIEFRDGGVAVVPNEAFTEIRPDTTKD
jgi:hypothetical protein